MNVLSYFVVFTDNYLWNIHRYEKIYKGKINKFGV